MMGCFQWPVCSATSALVVLLLFFDDLLFSSCHVLLSSTCLRHILVLLSFFLSFFFYFPPLASPNTISSLHFSSLYDLLYPPYLLIYILFLISGR